MRRFSFSLEPVLRYRTQAEQQRRRELAEAQQAVLEQQDELQNLVLSEQGQMSEMRLIHGGPLDVPLLLRFQQYLHHLARRIEESVQQLKKRMETREERRLVLVAASKQRRVLERLRERRWQEYQLELGREEQRMLDEIGAGAYVRALNEARRLEGEPTGEDDGKRADRLRHPTPQGSGAASKERQP